MRWARALVLPLLVFVLVACGSSGASSNGNGNGNGNGSSDAGEPTATTAASEDGGGGGGGGGGDVEQIAEQLVPPNSSETSRTTANGVIFVTYTSTDSPETLKGFYEDAIPRTGWNIYSTTTVSGSYSWIFAESEGSSNGGVVSVAPDSDGSGSAVVIQVGAGG